MSVGRALTTGIYVVAAKRTAFGTFLGSLASYSPVDMLEWASKASLESAGVAPSNVNAVVAGSVISCSTIDTPLVSRHVGLRCGVPEPVPALTVNRLCASGFQAVVSGCQQIHIGDADLVLTGGTESMSLAPHTVRGLRTNPKLGGQLMVEDFLWQTLADPGINMPMGVTAENLAVKYDLKREEVDAFALRSQEKWKAANDGGYFKDEITPVSIKNKKKVTVIFNTDEHPRPNTNMESLSKLPTVFKKDGVVTAGSSSGISDGAAAVLIASEEACKRLNLSPLARIVGYGAAGCDPTIMGIGPVPAIQAMMAATGVSLGEVEQIEINEAFSAQVLACQKALDIPMEKLNTCGGAIALGHPLAASGARITGHLVHKIKREGAKYGVGSACIGGGQGMSVLLENVS